MGDGGRLSKRLSNGEQKASVVRRRLNGDHRWLRKMLVHEMGSWTRVNGHHGSLPIFIDQATSPPWTGYIKFMLNFNYVDFFLILDLFEL